MPWRNRKVFGAAGISAGGWDSSNNFYLLSNDGYSRNDPISGQMIEFVSGFEVVNKNIHKDDLHFTIPNTGETINIFGIRAGDGLHVTQDGWVLEKIYPWYPRETVIMYNARYADFGKQWIEIYAINLINLGDGWLKCGFSASQKHFAILGEAGAETFSRE
jgi:hypothetical protein